MPPILSSLSARFQPASASVTAALLFGTLNLAGCPVEGGGFVASLEVSPRAGPAPLATTFNVQADGAGPLQYRYDFDGDGEFDTELLDENEIDHVFEAGGTFASVVEVTSSDGSTATARAVPPVSVQPALADIDVDTDRNGIIDSDDEIGEDTFTAERGAIALMNVDDDDGDGERDVIDGQVDTEADLLDMAAIRIAGSWAIQATDTVTVRVEPPAARDRIRIFRRDDDGDFSVVFSPAEENISLDANDLAAGDIELFLESIGRGATWDGRVELTLDVERGGDVIGSDVVQIESAPVIFPDNSQAPKTLYVMRITQSQNAPNQPMFNRIVETLPTDMTLFTVDEFAYYGDRWVQDNMQAGFQEIPTADGSRVMTNFLEAERYSGGYGLELLVPEGLLSADFGFSYPGGSATSHNYGGNLEIAPAHEGPRGAYPLGRILAGGGSGGTILGRANTDTMAADQVAWMDAQRVQGPVLNLSSEWLAVGHLDEYFLFVPDTRSVEDGGRADKPWRIVVASPELAAETLLALQGDGGGDAIVFEGRRTATTVDEILNDDDLLAYNDAVQARIDSEMDLLTSEMGLVDDDFIYVPVLYEAYIEQGYDFALALNPGIQNMIVAAGPDSPGVLYVPDPEGPRDSNGVDIWGSITTEALAPLGHQVELVDVFNSYHLLWGEAHCGSNVERYPPTTRWWDHLAVDNRGRQ